MGIIPPFTSASDRYYRFLRVFNEYYGSRGGTIGLYVEGGVAPYTWAITGDDFTLDAAETDEQYNFVTVAEDAVLDNHETVTVTDAEGSEVTMGVCTCNPYDCCEDEDYDFEGIDIPDSNLNAGETVQLTLSVGCPRFHWEIYDTDPAGHEGDFSLRHAYTNTRVNWLTASDDVDGDTVVTIKVTDDCGDEYAIFMTPGYPEDYCEDEEYSFEMDWDNTPVTIVAGGSTTIIALGGEPPYAWELVGTATGYSLDAAATMTPVNVIRCEEGACGVDYAVGVQFKVTDNCETELTGKLRNTAGDWCNGGATWQADADKGAPCNGWEGTAGAGDRCELHYVTGNGMRRWRYHCQCADGLKDCVGNNEPTCIFNITDWAGDIAVADSPCPYPTSCGTWDAACVAYDPAKPQSAYTRVELHYWDCTCPTPASDC